MSMPTASPTPTTDLMRHEIRQWVKERNGMLPAALQLHPEALKALSCETVGGIFMENSRDGALERFDGLPIVELVCEEPYTILEALPEDRRWEVYSTALQDGVLMLRCRATKAQGIVRKPSREEWAKAFNAPGNPYPWTEPRRVEVTWQKSDRR